MKGKLKINVEMFVNEDTECGYYWEVLEFANGIWYKEYSGIGRTPLIAFAEATEASDNYIKG